MCDPVTIGLAVASTAISITSSVASHVGQAKAAAAQQNYQNQLVQQRDLEIKQNNQLALQNQQNQQLQANERMQQENAASSQQVQQYQLEALRAKASQRVSSGEAGVSGLSIDNLYNDFERQEALFRDSVKQNNEFGRSQAAYGKQSLTAQNQGYANSVRPYNAQQFNGPSLLATSLQIGATAANAGMSYYKARPPKPNP